MNLHNVARGAIQAVNPDIIATYLESSGYTQAPDGRQVPTYRSPLQVRIQAQPPSGDDLKQIDYLNMEGVFRSVFIYGWPQGVNRVNVQGGDLLMFPQFPGAPYDNWLVKLVDETWAPDNVGWSHLIVVLQTDGRLILINNESPALNPNGTLPAVT